ncbi:hypothetical protein HYU23_00890 [Candidatus Woesearchaeota archaeon]|nr:hypothetical protein [Candidatus Woesearchaeota archaeon]
MKYLALDVVILLPKEISKKIISMNRKQIKLGEKILILNNRNSIPHISLAIGYIDTKYLNVVKDITRKIVAKFSNIDVEIENMYKTALTGSLALKINKSKKLQEFHESIIDGLRPYFSLTPSRNVFYKSEKVDHHTIDTVKNYVKKASYEKFTPHITIATTGNIITIKRIKFKAEKVALCQLGLNCTCSKIIFSFNLEKQK